MVPVVCPNTKIGKQVLLYTITVWVSLEYFEIMNLLTDFEVMLILSG